MNTLEMLVRHQVLMEGPQICDPRAREQYIDEQINGWTNVELLERISAQIAKSVPPKGIEQASFENRPMSHAEWRKLYPTQHPLWCRLVVTGHLESCDCDLTYPEVMVPQKGVEHGQ